MNSARQNRKMAKNWTCEQHGGTLIVFMKRKLRIQVAFEPTRMGEEHLHQAYELVVPVQRRRVKEAESSVESTETEHRSKYCKKERGIS